jgi:hypothetical protein
MDQEVLPSVHHALSEATQELKSDKPMGTYTFRIGIEDKEAAEEICNRHGVTLAEYFRACARILPRDYKP